MLKSFLKLNKHLSLLVAGACLTTALGSSPTLAKTDVLIPITYLLLEDAEAVDQEFGSLIPGKLYSARELEFWRQRAENGPYVLRGDAYGSEATGSAPEYSIILASARNLESTDDSEIIVPGRSRADLISRGLSTAELEEISFSESDCAALDPDIGETFPAWYEFGRFGRARDAALVDLINDTSINTARIKSLLLTQAQQPCMDFNNREIFRNGPVNNNSFWLMLEWLHRVLKTYDYVDDSVFTENEKAIIDSWFKGAAQWAHYYVTTTYMEPVYKVRALDPLNSVIDLPSPSNVNNTGYWLNRPAFAKYRIRYEGSSAFWPAGSLINNRQLGQVNFLVHAGVKFELNRASDTSSTASMNLQPPVPVKAEHGLSYGANSLINIAEMAHILYLDGHENLYEYKSKAKINEESGEIEEGSVEKSLEWVLLKFRENFMLNDAPEIYPLGLTSDQQNTDTVIHFCANTHRGKLGTSRIVGRMYSPAAIINSYYKNPLIKEIYNASQDYGNLCGYEDTKLEIRPGPHGVSSGALFLYSDADELKVRRG